MAKICIYCQKDIDDTDIYCPYCGTKQENICPYCGNRIEDDDVYCPYCGKKIKLNIPNLNNKRTEVEFKTIFHPANDTVYENNRTTTIIAAGDTVSDKLKLLVMAMIAIIISIGIYHHNVPHNDPFTVTSSRIIADYQHNSQSAEKTYSNKRIVLEGDIAQQYTDKDGVFAIFKDSTEKEMLIAMIPKSHPEWKDKLTADSYVTITGICVGRKLIPKTKDQYCISIVVQSVN